MNNISIFILVGGLGTRLKGVVSDVPKPMAIINGKPFLWYKIMQLKKRGFKNIVFLSGFLHQKISDYFGDGTQFGLNIQYSIESSPLGTGGALKNAEKFIDKPFFMCNGDVYVDFDPQSMIDIVTKNHSKNCILLTKPSYKGDFGVVKIDSESKVIEFKEKPKEWNPNNLINAGVYYFHQDILNYISPQTKISIEKDIFPKIVAGPLDSMYAVELKGYFIDIGIPESYFRFCEEVKNKRIDFN